MIRVFGVTAMAALAGCVGSISDLPNGGTGDGTTSDGTGGGPTQTMVSGFQALSAGLPANPTLAAMAQLNGTLYSVTNNTLYAAAAGATAWSAVTLPTTGSETINTVARVGTAIYVTTTAASAGHGNLYTLGFGADAFTKVTTAPDAELYALTATSDGMLLTTKGALMASTDGVTWTQRSTDGLFLEPVMQLIASPAATRIFALANGTLNFSDDSGATWRSGLVTGTVSTMAAAGAFALVQTDNGTLRSDNYGNTFHAIDLGMLPKAFALTDMQAFAGTATGLRISDDGGASWRDSGDGLPASTPVTQLFLSDASLVASVSGDIYVAQVQ